MPYTGDTYALPAGSVVSDGTTASASQHNTPLQDIETALTTAKEASSAVYVRNKLTAGEVWYVNSVSGSDSNDGLTSGNAFATIDKARQTIMESTDVSGYNATISLADGTYTTGATFTGAIPGGGAIYIAGNASNPENVIISTTSANAIGAIGCTVYVQNLEVRTTTSGDGLYAYLGGVIYYNNIRFGACAASHLYATSNSAIVQIGNATITGNAVSHIHGTGNAQIYMLSAGTTTLSGTPAFSAYFVGLAQNAVCNIPSNHTFSGSGTGQRYWVHKASVLDLSGRDPETLPGDSNGKWDAGGIISGRSIQGRRREVEVFEHDANANDSHTGDTNATTLKTVSVDGGLLGANGFVRIRTRWSMTGSSSKSLLVYFGATAVLNQAFTTDTCFEDIRFVSNVNSESSQRARHTQDPPYGSSANGYATASIDTSSSFNIQFTTQLTNAADSVTLEEYTIESCYQP